MAERPSKKVEPKEAKQPKAVKEKQGSGHLGEQPAVTLSVADIRELVMLMKQNSIAEISLEQSDTKLRIVSTQPPVAQPTVQQLIPMASAPLSMAAPVPAVQTAPAQAAPAEAPVSAVSMAEAADASLKLTTILSPMVGTFYRAPAPDAPTFVEVGDMVKTDTTLCIIEAMKIMNEIKAETKGRVHKILVENGNPVEYNQPLFQIENV